MLSVLVPLVLLGAVSSKCNSTGIGQGFYLPELSLVEDNGNGNSIFKKIPSSCLQQGPSKVNHEEKTFYEDTKSFYSKLGVESSLSGEVTDGFTLGFSVQSASESIDSENLDIKGMSMDAYAITGFWEFLPHCYTQLELNEEFMTAFERLPAKVSDPSKSNSWYDYDVFLKTYGSHMTKRISHGSKLTQYVFSKSSEKINTLQFSIKACATLQDLNLTLCSNFSKEDYAKVTQLDTSESMTVRGGSAKTRAKLITNPTGELFEKFLTEANLTDQPVSVQYESIWNVLRSRYLGSEHFAKSINLEAYYLGFLSTGCGYEAESGLVLRKFVLKDDDPHVPQYECQLAPLGCRSNNDCHIGGAGSVCYCYGNSCVEEREIIDPRHSVTKGRNVRVNQSYSYKRGVNKSCRYHVGVHCKCRTGWGGDWETVWPTNEYRQELSSHRLRQLKALKAKSKK